ncbi:MAG TPA: hypothetical protein VH144_00620 [Candidatus Saccharimonadales bacterium]|jgi:hypothetical protein|nr:hypothetical protein [Candidatus Saccharimonadales bacterium]
MNERTPLLNTLREKVANHPVATTLASLALSAGLVGGGIAAYENQQQTHHEHLLDDKIHAQSAKLDAEFKGARSLDVTTCDPAEITVGPTKETNRYTHQTKAPTLYVKLPMHDGPEAGHHPKTVIDQNHTFQLHWHTDPYVEYEYPDGRKLPAPQPQSTEGPENLPKDTIQVFINPNNEGPRQAHIYANTTFWKQDNLSADSNPSSFGSENRTDQQLCGTINMVVKDDKVTLLPSN